MTQTVLRKLVALAGLEGVLLLAVLLYVGTAVTPESLPGSVQLLPLAVLVAGFVVSWRYGRSRLVFGLVLLAFADRALMAYPGADGPSPVFHLVAFLLPLNFLWIAWVEERGTFTPLGQGRLAAILLQAAVVMLLAASPPGWVTGALQLSPLPDGLFAWTPVEQPALLMFAASLGVMVARQVANSNATGRGFLWAMVASFVALSTARGQPIPTLYFSTAGLILIASVIEASYFMAYRDSLTGLPARRALNEDLLKLNGQYTIAMVDVDRFKSFNDRYGHQVGDQVLRKVASQLAKVGGGGRAFRYGGEEFALVFPGKGPKEVSPELEALRAAIEEEKFALRGKDRPKQRPEGPKPKGRPPKKVSVTVSIGAAGRSDRRSAPSEVITFADQALYQAKKDGRNRVKVLNGKR